MEIIIAAVLIVAALYVLYRNIREKAAGKCSSCPESTSGCSCCNAFSKK